MLVIRSPGGAALALCRPSPYPSRALPSSPERDAGARVFFALSKVADLLAAPLTWALLLCAAAAILALRGRRGSSRAAAGCLLVALLLLSAFSTEAVANALFRSLERGAVSSFDPRVTYDAVLLLGGLLDAEASESSGMPDYTDAVERLLRTYELLRAGHARNVLISGGATDPRVREAVEARVLARQLEAWGIEPSHIVVEDRSRNTRENALAAAALVRQRGWKKLLLVTSAYHLPRAEGCFRAVGLRFDSLPVDFRAHDAERFPSGVQPRAENLSRSTFALHEFVGRWIYRRRGWSLP
jgi:uncharacterized SAM-binding protein YcdF (DUF218 family)